ncbi:low molecular weight phosphatase family protein [Subtercola vilae]|uniref:arsenate reductase/protein-tyrosine-phosphatase family protein n=1 Tax=Subtercola vilae TaxID=2056433 RepID=UPI001375AF72|nr:low molecular weight phosphatase family protein [Subtercola vilae]
MADFEILTVCSGNICRSPLAQLQLQSALRDEPNVVVESAGVVAGEGDPVTPQTAAIALSLGLDASEHRALYLTERLVQQADLLLAMSRSHRRAIVELVPKKIPVTFTVREFARLSASLTDQELAKSLIGTGDPSERMKLLVARVRGQRGSVDQAESPGDDDVTDPYGKGDEIYQKSVAELMPALEQVARVLRLHRLQP